MNDRWLPSFRSRKKLEVHDFSGVSLDLATELFTKFMTTAMNLIGFITLTDVQGYINLSEINIIDNRHVRSYVKIDTCL